MTAVPNRMPVSRLIRPAELPLPCPVERLFGRRAPLGLDLGCGDGRFLARMAGQEADWNWLGVEVSGTYVRRALARLRRSDAGNARLLHGTAGFALRYVLPPASVTALYVNFPDPWPKARHQRRRLLQESFLRLAATRLLPGGRLYLTTDHAEYCAFVAAEARATGLYAVVPTAPAPDVLHTKYAAKWQAAGRTIYHVRLELAADAPNGPPPLARFPMPHAILSGRLPEIVAFEKQVRALPDGHVVIVEAMRSLADGSLVFLGRVSEPDLQQSVLVEARPHHDGVIVRLRRFGHPLVTAGVCAAVGCVAEWLAGQGLVILRRYA